MGNPFFNPMGGGVPNVMQLLQQIKADPATVLAKRFNLPARGMNDPNAIIQHLVQSGQVSQERLNAVYQQAQQMGLRR